jgi:hypothetical protein
MDPRTRKDENQAFAGVVVYTIVFFAALYVAFALIRSI